MCKAEYPQVPEIIDFIRGHSSAAKQKDWLGLTALQYLGYNIAWFFKKIKLPDPTISAMNKNISAADIRKIIDKAPAVKADFE